MDLLIAAVLFVFGAITMVKGELKLSKSKISRGGPARIAGLLLILALPIALLVSTGVATVMAFTGRPLGVGDSPKWVRLLPHAVMVFVAVLALVVAFRGTGTPPKA